MSASNSSTHRDLLLLESQNLFAEEVRRIVQLPSADAESEFLALLGEQLPTSERSPIQRSAATGVLAGLALGWMLAAPSEVEGALRYLAEMNEADQILIRAFGSDAGGVVPMVEVCGACGVRVIESGHCGCS